MSLLAVIFTIYGIIGLLGVRPIAGHFAWTFVENGYRARDYPNTEQWFGATCIAVAICALWPLGLLWLVAGSKMPKLGMEREIEIENNKRRIEELERELKLR